MRSGYGDFSLLQALIVVQNKPNIAGVIYYDRILFS